MKCDACSAETTHLFRLKKLVITCEDSKDCDDPTPGIYELNEGEGYCVKCAPAEIKEYVDMLITEIQGIPITCYFATRNK